MKRFSQLFRELDQTTRTGEKLAALECFFRETPPGDAVWVLHFLLGKRGRRPLKTTTLKLWTAEVTALPLWLVEECHEAVGDLAETLALLLENNLPPMDAEFMPPLHEVVEQCLLPLASLPEERQRELWLQTLAALDQTGRFLFLKMMTGGFRMGASRALVVRALAAVAGVDRAVMEHRLTGAWKPRAADFTRLLDSHATDGDPAQPYPFFLASSWDPAATPLDDASLWQFEWKWDGIRAQLIRRCGQTVLWSRGEEVITPGFPEISEAARALPEGTVLDGELLAWRGEMPLPFQALQKREGPVLCMAYDLREHAGADLRGEPLAKRRARLEQVIADSTERARELGLGQNRATQGELFADFSATVAPPPAFALRASPLLAVNSPAEAAALREQARARGAEGLMIKRRDSPYGTGRERGAWWKWKVDPRTIDAVLIAAQPGHGKRAGLFTDYTFGIWRGGELVSFAKACSGLTAEEIREVDQWVRAHTTARHGPVRAVKPELVFELAFEGVQNSPRHKSGFALRFPRILRWRRDKNAAQANSVEALQS